MLCIALFVATFAAGCRGDGDNSSTEQPMLLLPPPVVSRRMSAALVHKLRRQLMRDNYDYQNGNSNDERNKQNTTQWSGGAKFYYQKAGTDNLAHIPRTLENAQTTKNAFNADQLEQQEQHEQYDQHEQDEQQEQPEEPEQRPVSRLKSRFTSPKSRDEPAPDSNQDALQPNEPDVRNALGANFSPDRRDNKPARVEGFNPSYYNKRRDAFDPPYPPEKMQVVAVSGARGKHKKQYVQDKNDAAIAGDEGDAGDEPAEQEEPTAPESNVQNNPDKDDALDQYDAIDQQDASDQQDPAEQQDASNQESDYSDKQQAQAMYDAFGAQGVQRPVVTRANHLQYYAPNARDPEPPPPRLDRQLRRHNDVSADMSLNDADSDQQVDDEPAQPRPNPAGTPRRPAPTEPSIAHRHRTERAPHSIVVTVSAANVTYKLLTMGSRSGRRLLQERAPGGVALVGLDRAPPPALRLPRGRRQYMRERPDAGPPLRHILPQHRRHRAA